MEENPYKAPLEEQAWHPSWQRRLASVTLFLMALFPGLLGLLMGIGSALWLYVEADGGGLNRYPLFGLQVSLGQGLLLGASVSMTVAFLLVLLSRRIVRPPRPIGPATQD